MLFVCAQPNVQLIICASGGKILLFCEEYQTRTIEFCRVNYFLSARVVFTLIKTIFPPWQPNTDIVTHLLKR